MSEGTSEVQASRRGLSQRDAIVFLVDWRQSMLAHDPSFTTSSLNRVQSNFANSDNKNLTPTLLSLSLRVIAHIIRRKLILRETDPIAVIAFGVTIEASTARWPGVRVLRSLAPSNASAVQLFQSLAARFETSHSPQSSYSESAVDVPVAPDEPVQFDKALWAARHQFSQLSATSANVLYRRRVFVLTADDDPCAGSTPVHRLSLTQARDLADLGANLDVTLLTIPSQFPSSSHIEGTDSNAFDVDTGIPDPSRFFNSLVYADDGSPDRGSVSVSTVHSFDSFCSRILSKQASKRAVRMTYIVLGRDYKIGVALYAPIRRAARPAKVELVAETNKPVFKITTVTCEAVGDILKPQDVRTMFLPDFVKEEQKRAKPTLLDDDVDNKVSQEEPHPFLHGFSAGEIPKIKAIGKEGIVIYGFKPYSATKKEYNLGPATFVAPYDGKYSGSTRAFAVLHACMLKQKVVAFVSIRRSSSSGMRFAVLVPQEEKFAKDGEPLVAGGMHLHYLPYKDDVYTMWRNEMPSCGNDESDIQNDDGNDDENSTTDAKSEKDDIKIEIKEEDVLSSEVIQESAAVTAARQMVRKLKMKDYNPDLFANPDLQRFYNGLEMAAGVETTYHPEDDLLTPGVKLMKERAGHLMAEVKRLDVGTHFDGVAVANRFGTKTGKRAAEANERVLRKQVEEKQKQADAAAECDTEMFMEHFRNGSLSSLLVKDLQVYCRAFGLNHRGPKRSLVIAIEDHISQGQNAGELPKNELEEA